jgi:tRNA threonylcarbamoyladenosine biosynthesis protein TsaB
VANILAIECSNNNCLVMIKNKAGKIFLREENSAARHAEYLVPMIDEILIEAAISYAEIERIAVCNGPGSFTGIRAGLACAEGISATTGCLVLGFSRFFLAARQLQKTMQEIDSPLLVLWDARRDQVYAQLFAAEENHEMRKIKMPNALSEAGLLEQEEIYMWLESFNLTNGFLFGDAEILPKISGWKIAEMPDYKPVLALFELAEEISVENAEQFLPLPFYIRPPDAKVAKANFNGE